MGMEALLTDFLAGVTVRKYRPADALDYFRERHGREGLSLADSPAFVQALAERGVEGLPRPAEAAGGPVLDVRRVAKYVSSTEVEKSFRRAGIEGMLQTLVAARIPSRMIVEFLGDNHRQIGEQVREFFDQSAKFPDVQIQWNQRFRLRGRSGTMVRFLQPFASGIVGEAHVLTGDEGDLQPVAGDNHLLVYVKGDARLPVTVRRADEGVVWRYM